MLIVVCKHKSVALKNAANCVRNPSNTSIQTQNGFFTSKLYNTIRVMV